MLRLYNIRSSRRSGTITPWSTWRSLVHRVSRVQPQHIRSMIIPKGHHQHHTSIQCLTHLRHTAFGFEIIRVPKYLFVRSTHFVRQRIIFRIESQVGHWMLNHFAILNKQTFDLFQSATVRLIISDKLGDYRHRLSRIHLEIGSLSKECLIASTIGIEITTIFITMSFEPVSTITTGYLILTASLSLHIAWMSCKSRCHIVGFPDIHLSAAGTIFP